MTGRVITKTDVIATLRDLVNRVGADTVRGCTYVQPNGDGGLVPYCIAGHAFVDWGMPAENLRLVNVQSVSRLHDEEWRWGDLFTLTDAGAEVLNLAQVVQDKGEPWGVALQRAEGRAAELSAE